MTDTIKAVIWDFGGVITSSPFDAFAVYEQAQGLPKDFIRKVNSQNPDSNAWAKLERSEVDGAGFDKLFREESKTLGHEVSGAAILKLLSGAIRPRAVNALKVCKLRGKVGCITNNAPIGKGASMTDDEDRAKEAAAVLELFDHVIESSKAGVRKPNPRIYEMMCEELDVDPKNCVYLDDLGINLKPARAMGMTTIKVLNENQLISDLAGATGYHFD